MTKGELAVIVKKVQAECGLEDPIKITYYRDEEGKVVFKLWFDSLILPETLAGKKKDEFEWQANVNNTFINNESYLYDDDFTILEYNEEKGWVKVLPDQQDFEIVESYNKLIDSKDEDLVRLQGKKLNEKVAKAYSLTLYEAEDEVASDSDIDTSTNDPNFTQREVENKKDEETNKVEEKVPTIFFAFSLCCPGLVVEEYKAFAKLIQEANEKAGQSENKATVKLIYFNSADSAALALLDMGQMISILESQGIKTNNSNFIGSDMKSIIDTLTGENVCDLSKSHVIASATAAEKIAKEYASLQKLITAENTIKGYDHIEFAKIRDAMTKLEQLSSDRMSQVLEPLAKSISEAYCKAADDGKIAAAKKATGSKGEEKKEKDPEAPKVDKSKENSEEGSGENSKEGSGEGSGEKSEQNESRRLLKSILAGRLLEDEGEKKPESKDDSFTEAWKNAFEKYGDGTGLPEPNQALIIYLDSYLANHGGGDINRYYPQSEAKQNFEDRNNAAKAAFEQVKDMKANSRYTIDSLMKVGLMKTVAAKIASKGLKDDDFQAGDNANGESKGFSFKQTNKPQPISPDKKEFKAKEHAKLTAVDYHIFSTMNIEPPKEAADKLAMYWTAQGIER